MGESLSLISKLELHLPLDIDTIQLDAVTRRADDLLLQNLIADDDQLSEHVELSVPDIDDLDQVDLEVPNIDIDVLKDEG